MKRLLFLLCLALPLLPACFREIPSVGVVTVQLRLDGEPSVPVDQTELVEDAGNGDGYEGLARQI